MKDLFKKQPMVSSTEILFEISKNPNAIVYLLTSSGADVQATDDTGKTPLMYACLNGEDETLVEQLIQHGSNVNASDFDGNTPLMLTIKKNPKSKIIECLLNHGADVNLKNLHGQTALNMAIDECESWIIYLLLEHGAEVNFYDANGLTPLMYATKNNQDGNMSRLIESGANVNAKSEENKKTPLMYAFTPYAIDVLLNNNADIDARDCDGKTALMHACMLEDWKIAVHLIECGANVNVNDNYGQTALHLAAGQYFANTDLIEKLLENGANINARDDHGDTALLNACESSIYSVAELLIKHNADVNVTNNYGYTIMDAAKKSVDEELLSLIERYSKTN